MGNLRLKSWFFEVTQTISDFGTRFRSNDKPPQATFEDLIESTIFKTEPDDKATTDQNGHVRIASSAEAKGNAAQFPNYTSVVIPEQLPQVYPLTFDYGEEVDDFNGYTLESTEDTSGANKKYRLKVSQAFYDWIRTTIGAATPVINFATNDDIATHTSTDTIVSPANLPVFSTTAPVADADINTYDSANISIVKTPASNGGNAYDSFDISLSSGFRTWLKQRLDALSISATALSYVAYDNGASPTLSGTGSIVTPYNSLHLLLTYYAANPSQAKPIVVLNTGYTETLSGSYTYSKNIELADGVVLYSTAGGADSGSDPASFLFTANSSSFCITGNGTFVLWNKALLDTAGYSITNKLKFNIYANAPFIKKALDNLVQLDRCNFYNQGSETNIPSLGTGSQRSIFTTTARGGNMYITNCIFRFKSVYFTIGSAGSNDIIKGCDFYSTVDSIAYVSLTGVYNSVNGFISANNVYDSVNSTTKYGIDITGFGATGSVTSNRDNFSRSVNSGKDIVGNGSGDGSTITVIGSITGINSGAVGRPATINGSGFTLVPSGSVLYNL